MEKVLILLKKHKKLLLIFLAAVLSIFIIWSLIIFPMIKEARTKEVWAFLDGKTFITGEYTEAFVDIYTFNDGKVASEAWMYDEVKGDISKLEEATTEINVSPFNKEYATIRYGDGKAVGVFKNDAGDFFVRSNSKEISLQEVESLRLPRKYAMCKHEFGEATLLKESTCSVPGEEKVICKICNYENVREAKTLPHNYISGKCSNCGKEKSALSSSISANTWYLYKDVLQIQNCEISYAAITSNNVAATYYAVCQHCHKKADSIGTAGVEIGYPVEKIYTCKYCSKNTMIKLKIK